MENMDEKITTDAKAEAEASDEGLNAVSSEENGIAPDENDEKAEKTSEESTGPDEIGDETESEDTEKTEECPKMRLPMLPLILAVILIIISVGAALVAAFSEGRGVGTQRDRGDDVVTPMLATRDIMIPRGMLLEPTDFLSEPIDTSSYTVEFVTVPDTSVDGSVTVALTNSMGRITEASAAFTVTDSLKEHEFELGITRELMEPRLISEYRLDAVELSAVDTSTFGTYRVSGELDGKKCVFTVKISDTTPPTALVYSFDLLLGQTVDINDIVTDISDASEVTMVYSPEPDCKKAGSQEISITLTDESSNVSEYTSFIAIHTLPESMVIEAGTSYEALASTISNMLGTDERYPYLSDMYDPRNMEPGTHETELIGKYSRIPFEIIVEDTVPPEFSVRPITVYTGTVLSAATFVVGYTDFSEVSFEFADEPDFTKEGTCLVTVIGTDKAGNTAKQSTTLKVARDNVPPTIYGVKNITAYEGDTVSYRSGVYAMDEKDGKITVKADTSKVNTSKAGTYTVTYTASDAEGNKATATATVTIKAITASTVNEKADEVLAVIVNGSMSDREKARAIYDWCTGNLKYSTSTSHLMGYFNKAAYSGFTRHYGNCYTYYTVASALLTRAGITNMEIQRNDPKNPHYWNLVSIDGSWYHFDTCPQPAPHKLEVFLLTDAEVAAFSLDYYYKFASGVYPATP